MTASFDVAIVGGGIAGLSAGLSAARQGLSTLVLTGDALGGHLISIEKIEGYPGHPDGIAGYDLCPIVQEQAEAAGARVAMTSVAALKSDGNAWLLETGDGPQSAKAVIVATGTALKALGVPGEAALRGKGVSHCASCDAPLLRQKKVVVVGGGDSALQEALTLAAHAREVAILHHGPAPVAQATFVARIAASTNVMLHAQTTVAEILGGEVVTGVRARHEGGGGERELEADGVFVFVGLSPSAALVPGDVARTESGHVEVDARMRTSVPGLLAAGTVRAGAAGRAVGAAGDGALAAIAAAEYLGTGRWPGA